MSTKPKDPHYWQKYRATHPEYVARQKLLRAQRRKKTSRNRASEYANRPSRAIQKLRPLFEDLLQGTALSFWRDELRMDLRQEKALAELEGKDVTKALRAYQRRETEWHRVTTHLFED